MGCIWSNQTVRKLMTQVGLWLPQSRPPRVHQPRPRRACTGELIQIDGCEYRWSSIVVRLHAARLR